MCKRIVKVTGMSADAIQDEELVSPEIMEAMGISQPAYEEVMGIIGRMPTVQELSTLLAMWEANGRQQSLYGWLKGQHHVVEKHEYLYTGTDTTHKDIREPRVKDCIALAHEVLQNLDPAQSTQSADQAPAPAFFSRSELLYMVGNVSTQFLDSEYARRCLHIVADPVKMTTVEEDIEYLQLIVADAWASTSSPVARYASTHSFLAKRMAASLSPSPSATTTSSCSRWTRPASTAVSSAM